MKKKILMITIYVVLILITLKLLFNIVLNSIFISRYDHGQYSEANAKVLTYLNFPQSYIANYNYGNVLYQNGKYEEAIEEYKKALNGGASMEEECSIRINCALAICKTVIVDESSQASIKEAIATYESAIDVLTEKGCANREDNNGHSQKAEQLKEDIQKEIDRLKNLQTDESQSNKGNEEESKGKNEEQEEIEEKIQNIKEEAIKNQRDTEGELLDLDKKEYDYDLNKKRW